MFPGFSLSRVWYVVFFGAVFALMVGLTPAPAFAHHCKGPHANDPECTGGEPPPPPEIDPDFRPEIVYADTSGNLVVANADGTSPIIAVPNSGTHFVLGGSQWSPDGTEIIYAALGEAGQGIYRVSVFDSEGIFSVGNPQLITENENCYFAPRWSPAPTPDGSYWIAYSSQLYEPTQSCEIFLVNPSDPLQKLQLTNTGQINEHDPTWSPDGKRIAYLSWRCSSCQMEIIVADLGTNGQTGQLEITNTISLVDNNPHFPGSPLVGSEFTSLEWARGSDHVAVSARFFEEDDDPYEIWVIPPTQEGIMDAYTVLPEPASQTSARPVFRYWGAWSPDDTNLLYLRHGFGGTCDLQNPNPKKGKKTTSDPVYLVSAPLNPDGMIACGTETVITEISGSVWDSIDWWRGTPTP